MRDVPQARYRFGNFHLDVRDRRLTRDDAAVPLEPKSFDVLCCLLEQAGHLVSKQDLVDAVWARTFVSDNSLTRCIHQVRAALDDDAERPTYIETVPGSGYRFIAPVESLDAADSPRIDDIGMNVRKWIAAAAITLVVVVGATVVMQEPDRESNAPVVQRIAILPLANLTGVADQEYFVQGVHEALVAELSRISSIDVISRTSVMSFRDTELSVPEIAARLDVDAIIEGSVMRAGDKLTVTAQLIATNPERHLWAQRYHRDVNELFEITTDIVAAIASEIAVELSPDYGAARSSQAAPNGEAYEAYLRGRFLFEQRTPDAYRKAQAEFRRAIDLDPAFAPPYVGLGHTFGSAAIFGALKPALGLAQARALAEQAIELDDTLAEAHLLLAGVSFYGDWDWVTAERQANRVLQLNPSLANAHRFLSEVYSVTGRHEQAMDAVERGREIDPLPPTSQLKPALILYLMRDYDAAISRARAGLALYPEFWQGHWLLCISLSATAQHDEAIEACTAAVEYSHRTPMSLGALGYVKALGGDLEGAREILTELEALRHERYVGAASLAIIHGALGDFDNALVELTRAYEDRDLLLVHVDNYSFFDPLRASDQFHVLRSRHFSTP